MFFKGCVSYASNITYWKLTDIRKPDQVVLLLKRTTLKGTQGIKK